MAAWTKSTSMRASVMILLLGLFASGCGGDASSPRRTSIVNASPVCDARPDDATPGCFASPSSMICSPTGCQSLCAGGQTPVTCASAQPMGPIPAPDANAGCTIVPIPTPSNALIYCCSCGTP